MYKIKLNLNKLSKNQASVLKNSFIKCLLFLKTKKNINDDKNQMNLRQYETALGYAKIAAVMKIKD